MKLLLLSILGGVAIAVLALAQPTSRDLAAIKIGAVTCVAVVVGALQWPEHAAAIGVGVITAALIGALWHGVTWPIRYIASVFATAFRRQ